MKNKKQQEIEKNEEERLIRQDVMELLRLDMEKYQFRFGG